MKTFSQWRRRDQSLVERVVETLSHAHSTQLETGQVNPLIYSDTVEYRSGQSRGCFGITEPWPIMTVLSYTIFDGCDFSFQLCPWTTLGALPSDSNHLLPTTWESVPSSSWNRVEGYGRRPPSRCINIRVLQLLAETAKLSSGVSGRCSITWSVTWLTAGDKLYPATCRNRISDGQD